MPDPYPYTPDPYLSGGQYPYGARPRGPSWLLIAGVVMLVIAIGVGGYVAYDNRAILFPAGPPPTTPRPTTNALALATATPSASASPSGQGTTEPPDTRSPAPTATPSPVPGDLVDRFLASIGDPNLRYHFEASAVGLFNEPDLTRKVSFSLDFAGADYAGWVKGYKQTSLKLRLIVKDGVAYGKLGASPWIRSTDSPPQFNVLGALFTPDIASLFQDVGIETRDGEKVHHLRAFVPDTSLCAVSNPYVDFWVQADGRPVYGKIAISCTDSSQHGKLEWSNFDGDIVINAPNNYLSS
jgi:hypothetical protein